MYVFVNDAFRHSLLKYTCMYILSFKSNLILIYKQIFINKIVINFTEKLFILFLMAQQPPVGGGPPQYRGFTITVDRTPLDERSARSTDRYLTKTQHSQETDIHALKGFEPNSERPQTQTLDRAVTDIGAAKFWRGRFLKYCFT